MKFLFSILLLLSIPAVAEYRAFSLEVENLETGEVRNLVSTLDHIQYPQYYPLAQNEVIRYVDSWMCWGRTSKRPPCVRGTYFQEENQGPARIPAGD